MDRYYSEEIDKEVLNGVNMNAYSFIEKANENREQLTAFTYFGAETTYKEFKEKVNTYANNLLSYGLKKGDSITFLLPNTPEIMYYYYAAWILGVTVCPIDPRTNPNGIKKIVNDSNSRLLISILDKYAEKVSPILDDINVEKIVVVSPTDSMSNGFKQNIGKIVYKYKEFYLNLVDKDFSSDKIVMNKKFIKSITGNIKPIYTDDYSKLHAVNLFTSGTEGTPKTAIHSHQNYNVKAKQIEYALPRANPGDKFLGIIPFFSAYGSFQGMHNCLYRGMNIVLIPNFKPSDVPELICKHKPSTVIAVPNYWHDFSNRIDELMTQYGLDDLSFLKYPISGGDKQSAVDVKICNDVLNKHNADGPLMRGYGSTEVGGATITTVDNDRTLYEDNEYSGVPFPGVDYLIERKNGEEYGEILVSDPAMMLGYLNEPDETNRTIVERDGKKYVKMGDLFTVDESNRFYFQGRIKRAVMRPDGHTVHVLPIEEEIVKTPFVDECCVVGLKKKDGSAGTIPTAFIVVNDSVEKTAETVKKIDSYCLKELSERNRALAYVFVDELPRTLMDKCDYKVLEKLYIDDLPYYLVDDTFFKETVKQKKKC